MTVERDPGALRRWVRGRRAAGERIGFVPTMGALHEGHLQLVDRAVGTTDRVVASVFVNPLQFGPGEDLDAYPRSEERDRELLVTRGVAMVFAPSAEVMFPVVPAIRLTAPDLTRTLCGPYRPGHFEGVLTVVAKLLHICEPDVAVFGRKDAQQALLIRRMVTEFDFPVEVDIAPTVRAPDGVALSSRNAYLSSTERAAAPVLSRALQAGHEAWRATGGKAEAILTACRAVLVAEPLFRRQYEELVDPEHLAPVTQAGANALLAIAGFIGRTRLLDNILVGEGMAGDVVAA